MSSRFDPAVPAARQVSSPPPLRCALLAAWGSAWLAGSIPVDAALDAVLTVPGLPDGRHVAGGGFGADQPPVAALLADWRRAGARCLRLALPVPGDVRGMAGDESFRGAALDAGEAVFGDGTGATVRFRPSPSSAGPQFVWHRSDVDAVPPDHVSMSEAEHDLTEAIRETASVLARRGAASWMADVAPALADARRAGERLNLPPTHPRRGVRLAAQGERMRAVLALVDADGSGEVNSTGLLERDTALAPLRIAVRRALLAGYNASAEMV